MKLSIIIVNYNVMFFLEQCLHSVQKAIKNISAEVFVVDNNSVDGSCAMLHEKFQEIQLIENKKNLGFSKANNQAIKKAKGEYIVLLNPDTIVEEDSFEKLIAFADANPDAGGIGVKMIDGSGKFLPESKRGLPTPLVAFYKIFGLSKLFPRSKIFNKYHLGFLDKEKIHKIEILAGAFMFLRKSVLEKTGYLDEEYFMYGEDIDLSYRIIKAGYQNYYFPQTTIIHYKGESTKKGSINYVLVFYNAMIIFARKHFSKQNAAIYSFLIKSAVYLRAFLSIIKRIFSAVLLPLFDVALIYAGYYFLTPYWEQYKFSGVGSYPDEYLKIAVPVYVIIWILSALFSKAYQKPVKISRVIRGISIGTVIILILYSLLPEHYRFSRALILLGTLWAFVVTVITRLLLHLTKQKKYQLYTTRKKRIVIVGSQAEAERVNNLLVQSGIKVSLIGLVNINSEVYDDKFIGNISQIKEIVRINKIDEIIFSAKDMKAQDIIKTMLSFSEIKVEFKIAPPESISIIGSNSINTSGDLYVVTINSINSVQNRVNKRIFDFLFSVILFLFSPLIVLFQKDKKKFFNNLWNVLTAKYSFVGYAINNNENIKELPVLKPAIISTLNLNKQKDFNPVDSNKLNTIYAKNYNILIDLKAVIINLTHLDNNNS
ncbi:MAG: glycosyltransferase [Chlorobi bacterium]|nr:glycosyltransferase [Chlorobiota bacterium]